MNERQKYLFDLQGYLVIEDVLSEADCDLAIAKIKERARPMEKTPDGYDANGTWHSAAGLYEAGEPFLKLIDHPAITDVLTEIIGSHLRCDTKEAVVGGACKHRRHECSSAPRGCDTG